MNRIVSLPFCHKTQAAVLRSRVLQLPSLREVNGSRECAPVICPSSHANASATHWYDGQIPSHAEIRCQGFVCHCHDGKSTRTVVLATRLRQGFAGGSRVGSPELQRRRQARTHTPRPLLRQSGGRLSANHNDRWLWVPACAGTTANEAAVTRIALDTPAPRFVNRLSGVLATAGRIAQRESVPFTRERSKVRSLVRPPCFALWASHGAAS